MYNAKKGIDYDRCRIIDYFFNCKKSLRQVHPSILPTNPEGLRTFLLSTVELLNEFTILTNFKSSKVVAAL